MRKVEVDCEYYKWCTYRKRYNKKVKICPCNMQIKKDGTQVYPEDMPSVFKERRYFEYTIVESSRLDDNWKRR